MALPEQYASRLNQETSEVPGWSGQLLMFSGTVFFISIAVYFGMVFGYKPYLDGQVASLDKQIRSFDAQIPQDQQGKLTSFYSQIINLQNIFNQHVATSKMMAWLEKITSKNVYYSKMSMSSLSGDSKVIQLNLSGYARTPDDFSKQITAFQQDPLVQKVNAGSFSAPSSGSQWHFDITLFMSRNAIIQAAASS